MLKNYFIIAFRNIQRKKGYAFINIGGLAIGMAASVLILLWVQFELSVDRFHPKVENLYEVWNQDEFNGTLDSWNSTPKPLGPVLKEQYSEVKDFTRYNTFGRVSFKVGDNFFNEKSAYVDPGFLRMFDFPLIEGDSATVLTQPNTVVITEGLAEKLFGNKPALDQEILMEGRYLVKVSGVLASPPANTNFKFEALLPWVYLEALGWSDDNWGNHSVQTYVETAPGSIGSEVSKSVSQATKLNSDRKEIDLFLHPVSKLHLYSQFENGVNIGGRINLIRTFLWIAGFMLLIACINFMNLSTARSEKRAKEVGVRKVSGADRGMLFRQFIIESVLIAFLAYLVAILLVLFSLPAFNTLVGQNLTLPFHLTQFWVFSIAYVLVAGILAGSYPAFFLSSLQPIRVLKGAVQQQNSWFKPRQVLVVFQFTIAVVLISSTIIMVRQLEYGENRVVGYDKNLMIYHLLSEDLAEKYEAFRNELLQQKEVISLTRTLSPVTEVWSNTFSMNWQGKDPAVSFTIDRQSSDVDLVKTGGFTLLEGRDIDVFTFPSDSSAVLINETAVVKMGFENPIGEIIQDNGKDWKVVGVVQDFIMRSPFEPIEAVVVQGPHSWFNTFHIRFDPDYDLTGSLEITESIFKKYAPNFPFDYRFIDKEHEKKFINEDRTTKLTSLFSGLAIIISCLGLFGLASYMAEVRSKEISVRKVLGASVNGLVGLLSKEFIQLVLISVVLGIPVTWFLMEEWLSEYDYRISIDWKVFLITGGLAIAITFLTVSSQAIKAALVNPAKTLKSE